MFQAWLNYATRRVCPLARVTRYDNSLDVTEQVLGMNIFFLKNRTLSLEMSGTFFFILHCTVT